jgi:protein-disulfide isomerase
MSDSSPPNSPSPPPHRLKALLAAILAVSIGALGISVVALVFALGWLREIPEPIDFGKEIRGYVLANPEIIVEAANQLEARQNETEANELTTLITNASDEIFNDPASPVGGNPQGDVTLVEFFDYNCPYCRKAAPVLAELEAGDRGLRIVFKEFPILGPGSEFAARAALASRKQDKYLAFHKAMMGHMGKIDESSVLEIAADQGLDVQQLKKDMEDPAIIQAIASNLALAEKLRITGTPGFVAGKEMVRGLVPLRSMQEMIARARQQ